MIKKILAATNNKHKLIEINNIFNSKSPGRYIIIPPNELLLEDMEIDENGLTFQENAEIKAGAFYKSSLMPCIADDSGLEIDYLCGQPGINSARFDGIHGDDKANRDKVIYLMKNVKENLRTARFKCVICYKDSDKTIFAEGTVEGRIIFEERGNGGFGYDPIFIPDGYVQTFAEIDSEEKNKISHRARALEKLIMDLN
jgi:XTP/dITP diphosphohydrolase